MKKALARLTRDAERARLASLAWGAAFLAAMSYWAVARTEPNRENLAVACLTQAGFETLFPRVKANGHIAPLFSNYAFVALGPLGEGWHVANRTPGVISLVRFGDKPARVLDREIENLRSRMTGERGLITLPPPPGRRRFMKGEAVRIVGGPFEGLSAIHTGMTAHEREMVLIAMLGAQREVRIARHLIVAQ
jgi:transcriptional antiterminator RfaH